MMLLGSLYKVTHATKLVISLTESGEVCKPDHISFTPSTILLTREERLRRQLDKEREQREQELRSSSNRLKSSRGSGKGRVEGGRDGFPTAADATDDGALRELQEQFVTMFIIGREFLTAVKSMVISTALLQREKNSKPHSALRLHQTDPAALFAARHRVLTINSSSTRGRGSSGGDGSGGGSGGTSGGGGLGEGEGAYSRRGSFVTGMSSQLGSRRGSFSGGNRSRRQSVDGPGSRRGSLMSITSMASSSSTPTPTPTPRGTGSGGGTADWRHTVGSHSKRRNSLHYFADGSGPSPPPAAGGAHGAHGLVPVPAGLGSRRSSMSSAPQASSDAYNLFHPHQHKQRRHRRHHHHHHFNNNNNDIDKHNRHHHHHHRHHALRRASLISKSAAATQHRRYNWDPARDGYRASFRNFTANHVAFTPPKLALPASYRSGIAGGFLNNSNAYKFRRQSSAATSSSNGLLGLEEDETSFGTKIWGVRVVDVRFLLSIPTRDVLAAYISRSMELMTKLGPNRHAPPEAETVKGAEAETEQEEGEGEVTGEKARVHQAGRPSRPSSAPASIPTSEQDHPPPSRADNSKLSAASTGSVGLVTCKGKGKVNPVVRLQTIADDSADLMIEQLLMPRLTRSRMASMLSGRQAPTAAATGVTATGVGATTSLDSREGGTPRAGSRGRYHRTGLQRAFQRGGRGLTRDHKSISDRQIHFDFLDEDDEDEELAGSVGVGVGVGIGDGKGSGGPDKVKGTRTQPGQNRNNSNNGYTHGIEPEASASATTPRNANSRIGSIGNPGIASGLSSAVARVLSQLKQQKPDSEMFFSVELVDPQVNFFDPKTHSSLVIVAGNSTLEGKRNTFATVPPSARMATRGTLRRSSLNSQKGCFDPKRQQDIRLRMDGVSAFTVPTLDPNDVQLIDHIHWKHLSTTTTRKDANSVSKTNTGAGASNNSVWETATSSSVTAAARSGGSESQQRQQPQRQRTLGALFENQAHTRESPFMRMAIKDFQIRANYVFWTDVATEDLGAMQLRPGKDELVCTFKLELPVIVVDILSWQFHILLNVVRNVLLAPPPATGKADATASEAEEEKMASVVQLPRDPELLAQHDIRANLATPLDMRHKGSREELKVVVEDFLNTGSLQKHPGSARFVEVFIGSCTWILRATSTASTSAQTAGLGKEAKELAKEQIKFDFTGIYSTLAFSEDK